MTRTTPELFDLVRTGDWDKISTHLATYPSRIAELGTNTVFTVQDDGELGSWLEGRRDAQDTARHYQQTINDTLQACGHTDRVTITAIPAVPAVPAN